MEKFLANENVPLQAVEALRKVGHDVAWIIELAPGADERTVLTLSHSERRALLTFDKDFGELAFRFGQTSSCGVILLRPKLKSPDYLARFAVGVLEAQIAWENHFSVAQEGHLRVISLPA